MKRILLSLYTCCILFSCNNTSKNGVSSVKQVNFKKELQSHFKNHYASLYKSNQLKRLQLDSLQWSNTFYKNNGFVPIWINDSIEISSKADALIKEFSKANLYGLNASRYYISIIKELVQNLHKIEDRSGRYELAAKLEVLLTNSYFTYGKHLNYGVLDSIDSITVLPRKRFNIDMPTYIDKAYKSDSLIEKLLELQPDIPQYRTLQIGLTKYLKNASLSTNSVLVKNFRVDSTHAIKQSKQALVLHQYLDSITSDSLYSNALKKFQRDHALKPDGLIGKNTARALSMSPYDHYLKIVANLEMWRWKEPLETNHIFVNIPAYELKLIEDDSLTFESKIVVGKKKTATPEIKDSLQYVIAYPYWNVPRKISLEEIILKAQKDSTYFDRNNYELLTYRKDTVNMDTIDWNKMNEDTFTYLIRQKGGGSNSLGYVKFIFPNKYAIYLHDTPAKSLFKRELRSYSHGCVRVEKALSMASHILKSDENKYTPDSMYAYIKKRKEKSIKLNKTLPVYIYYFTVKGSDEGKLVFYDDLYGTDRKLTHLLIQQRNRFNKNLRKEIITN